MNLTLDELSNTELMTKARDLHGSLYRRINQLQRDLNIANAEIDKLEHVASHDIYSCTAEIRTLHERISEEIGNHEKTKKLYLEHSEQLKAVRKALGW